LLISISNRPPFHVSHSTRNRFSHCLFFYQSSWERTIPISGPISPPTLPLFDTRSGRVFKRIQFLQYSCFSQHNPVLYYPAIQLLKFSQLSQEDFRKLPTLRLPTPPGRPRCGPSPSFCPLLFTILICPFASSSSFFSCITPPPRARRVVFSDTQFHPRANLESLPSLPLHNLILFTPPITLPPRAWLRSVIASVVLFLRGKLAAFSPFLFFSSFFFPLRSLKTHSCFTRFFPALEVVPQSVPEFLPHVRFLPSPRFGFPFFRFDKSASRMSSCPGPRPTPLSLLYVADCFSASSISLICSRNALFHHAHPLFSPCLAGPSAAPPPFSR